jgi:cytochrome c
MTAMNRIGLAAMVGTALLLGACGGSSEEPAAPDEATGTAASTPASAAAETPAGEATAAADATPTPTPAASAAKPAVAVAAAPAAFNQCKVCHAVEKGKHGIGPSLAGIYGTKAGDIAGFEFSSAMEASGLVWNEGNLDRYLTDPRAVVPGTKMSFGGMKDAATRKEVIDYLKTL